MVKQISYNWPENFSIAIIKNKGCFTADAVKTWTSLLAEDTGMKVHFAYTYENNKANKLKWVHYGIADMTDGNPDEVDQVLRGDTGRSIQGHGRALYCGDRDTCAFQLRSVWIVSQYDSGFMVRGDSKIKDIYDVKPGVRVVDSRSYMPGRRNVEGFLAWAGIKDLENDVRWVTANSTEEKTRLIVDGNADIAWATPSTPATYEAEKNPHGLRWIDLNAEEDPEGAKRFHEKYLLVDLAPMVRGVQSARGHWGMAGCGQYCCRADIDIDFIYHLVKWLDENWDRYKDLHYWLGYANRKNFMDELDKTFYPCHDGLIKYLKQLGLWTDAHEQRQKQNVDLVDRYFKASREAMWLADEKSIVVSHDNPEWIGLWENYKKEQRLPLFKYLPSLAKSRNK